MPWLVSGLCSSGTDLLPFTSNDHVRSLSVYDKHLGLQDVSHICTISMGPSVGDLLHCIVAGSTYPSVFFLNLLFLIV